MVIQMNSSERIQFGVNSFLLGTLMKEIVFIINSLKSRSGTERVACVLANLFKSHLDVNVTLLNRDTDFNGVAYPIDPEIKVKKFEGNYLNFYSQLNQYLSAIQPDYVIVHNMGRLSLLTSLLNLSKNTKLISLEHVAYHSRPKFVQIAYKFLAKKFSQIIALTKHDSESYKKFHHNVVVIPNPSPFKQLSIEERVYDNNSKRIIAIGRLTYQKNFEHLLAAWKIVQNSHRDWTLEIYGSGEDKDKLQQIINHDELNSAKLMGEIVNIQSIYKSSSFYVMSSRYEGLPMVLIESQTFGLPIVSYDCPHGPKEIVHSHENGILVENQNINELAAALKFMIENPAERIRMSNIAFNDAKKFTEDSIVNSWKEKVLN